MRKGIDRKLFTRIVAEAGLPAQTVADDLLTIIQDESFCDPHDAVEAIYRQGAKFTAQVIREMHGMQALA